METSFLFLVHPYGAYHYNCMADIRKAFNEYEGHCQAIHQGINSFGDAFRIIMAKK